jgi:hypothetical protein
MDAYPPADIITIDPVVDGVVENPVAIWLSGENGPLLEDRSVDSIDLLNLVDVTVGRDNLKNS